MVNRHYRLNDGYRPGSHRIKPLAGIFLFFIFCTQAYICKAQENVNQQNEKWQINAGLALSSTSIIDQTFSSLAYSGTNIGGSLSVKYQKINSFHEIKAYYSAGTLNTSAHSGSLDNSYLNIDYTNLYNIGSPDNAFKFRGGGGIDILYAQRNYDGFVNNNYSFEFASSLSAVCEISYLFNNGRSGFSITDRLQVPFISAVSEPEFQSGGESGNFRALSFSSFFRLKNCLSVEKNLSSRQKLGLEYTWDFYRLNDMRDVKQVNHELALIYRFIF